MSSPPSRTPGSPDATEVKRLRAVVRGRVQGVGFRLTTEQEARRLNLQGWVRNLSDGAVEVEAEGTRLTLEALLSFLHHGPRGARVDHVVAEWSAPDGEPCPFEVRRDA